MFDITCLDKDGNKINKFTQWDKNQTISIELDYEWAEAPEIHFFNKRSKEAIVVKSILSDNNITVAVPNILLREASPIIIYVYEIDNISGRSVASIKLPVTPRLAPSNYEENCTEIQPEPTFASDYEYSISDNTVTIKKYIGTSINPAIPAKIEGLPVKKIGGRAFSETEVESVKIPEGVTEIV